MGELSHVGDMEGFSHLVNGACTFPRSGSFAQVERVPNATHFTYVQDAAGEITGFVANASSFDDFNSLQGFCHMKATIASRIRTQYGSK